MTMRTPCSCVTYVELQVLALVAAKEAGYTSKNAKRDGAYRRIVVQVDKQNVVPRTKRGYYAPTSR